MKWPQKNKYRTACNNPNPSSLTVRTVLISSITWSIFTSNDILFTVISWEVISIQHVLCSPWAIRVAHDQPLKGSESVFGPSRSAFLVNSSPKKQTKSKLQNCFKLLARLFICLSYLVPIAYVRIHLDAKTFDHDLRSSRVELYMHTCCVFTLPTHNP